jgi:hypothetical protein
MLGVRTHVHVLCCIQETISNESNDPNNSPEYLFYDSNSQSYQIPWDPSLTFARNRIRPFATLFQIAMWIDLRIMGGILSMAFDTGIRHAFLRASHLDQLRDAYR